MALFTEGGVEQLSKRVQIFAATAQEKTDECVATCDALVKDPTFQTVTIRTVGGAVTLGSIGGAFGLASGIVVGAGAGVIPAFLTLGMSIPAGAAIGGGAGLCVGGGAGLVGGSALGYGMYRYRIEIRQGAVYIGRELSDVVDVAEAVVSTSAKTASRKLARACQSACAQVTFTTAVTSEAVNEFAARSKRKTRAFTKDRRFQVASASAFVGGTVCGVSGSAVGALAGAAVGVVPALFTFGLSVPIGAAVGLCTGAVAGGTTGTIGGGVIGYSGYSHRDELREISVNTLTTARASVDSAKTLVKRSASDLEVRVKSYMGGGTGGTA